MLSIVIVSDAYIMRGIDRLASGAQLYLSPMETNCDYEKEMELSDNAESTISCYFKHKRVQRRRGEGNILLQRPIH